MNLPLHRMVRAVAVPLLGLAAAGAARADVVVHGKIEYWDCIAKAFLPARRVIVEVERKWCIDDPEVTTDDAGSYVCHLPNPMWGTHDNVRLQVYAQTNGLHEVSSWWFAWYSYHIISKSFSGLAKNSKFELNVRFGKPAGESAGPPNLNVADAPYRDEVDTAKAFMAHQEILSHYVWLKFWGWPNSAFDDIGVIAPAANPFGGSYYNHFTNNINLVSPASWSGTGEWKIEDKPDVSYTPPHRVLVNYPRFRMTCRHEASHCVHDYICCLAPFGLNMPAEHHPETETNRWLAYTEGFADFLALSTVAAGMQQAAGTGQPPAHLWEASDASGLKLPQGDHWAMEGEITGLLWDILDPMGYEPLRHPATKTADGAHALPKALVDGQRWWDSLEDPKGTMVWKVAQHPLFGANVPTPVQTIMEFIAEFCRRYPQSARDLKAVAFNRGITTGLPTETPAIIAAPVKLSRFASKLTLECIVQETDSEDRPYVRLTLYHQSTGGTITPVSGLVNRKLGANWTSALMAFKDTATLPPGFQPNDTLWLEVNDDMLPTFYRLAVPAKDESVLVAVVKEPKGLLWAGLPERFAGQIARASRQDFERALTDDWRVVGPGQIVPDAAGKVFAANANGSVTWEAGSVRDFTLTFRYRHAAGVADVLFCQKAPEAPQGLFHLMISDKELTLVRQAKRGAQEKSAAHRPFQHGSWYDLAVKRKGGNISVAVGNQTVLEATEPNPVAVDLITFGSLAGAGCAFDDIELVPDEGLMLAGGPKKPGLIEKVPPLEPAAAAGVDPQKVRAVRDTVREARRELRAHAKRADAMQRLRSDLYDLARDTGEALPPEPPALLRRVRDPRLAPKPQLNPGDAADMAAFRLWLAERAAGKPLAQAMAPERRALLDACAKSADAAAQGHRAAAPRAKALEAKLGAAWEAVPADIGNEMVRKNAALAIEELRKALQALASDTELAPALDTQRKALENMARQ